MIIEYRNGPIIWEIEKKRKIISIISKIYKKNKNSKKIAIKEIL